MKASYIHLYNESRLEERIRLIHERLDPCILCPHHCQVKRKTNEFGNCDSGEYPKIASYGPHFGEEPPLVGHHGSGTIFFTNCNLRCIFCQNFDISQQGTGKTITYEELADTMVELQLKGCHNINFVTPTHMIHAIAMALPRAIENGLRIPLVYNSGGYDAVETIRLLDGIFDIYMPDLKYFDNHKAYQLSGIQNYLEEATGAIREMHRQVGDLVLNDQGIAIRGLIIRHLILPENLGDTFRVIDFIKDLSDNSYLNLMDQYRPEFHAFKDQRMGRRISIDEFEKAIKYAKQIGIKRLAF